MARQLKLVRLDDFTGDIDSLDLFANGYDVAADGYMPVVAPLGDRTVYESITINLQGTSKDNLSALTQGLNDKIYQVQSWINNPEIERYKVWIRLQLTGETYPQQAQIVSIKPPDRVNIFTPTETIDNYIGKYTIGIERTAFWEASSPIDEAFSSIGMLGEKRTFSGQVAGDVPARLPKVTFYNFDSGNLNGGWIGFKSSRFVTDPENFIPNWPLNLSANMNNTSDVVDSTAVNGHKMTCTFSGETNPTLLDRAIVFLSAIASGNEVDFRGSYTVLLRAKMSDASSARARIGFGFAPPPRTIAPLIYRSRQVISGTDWKLYEMGSISIPSSLISTEIMDNFSISIQAERISGAGNLEMDCVILIPNEGMIRITDPYQPAVDVASQSIVYQQAAGSIFAFAVDGNSPYAVDRVFNVSPVNWSVPAGQSKVIMVYADAKPGDIKAFTLDINVGYIPRWRTLRGSDV